MSGFPTLLCFAAVSTLRCFKLLSDRDPVLCRLQDPNVTGTAGDVEEEWSPGQPRESAMLFIDRHCFSRREWVRMGLDPLSKRLIHLLPVYCNNRESNFWSSRMFRSYKEGPSFTSLWWYLCRIWKFILSIKKSKKMLEQSEPEMHVWENGIIQGKFRDASERCVFRWCLMDRPWRVTHAYGAPGLICPEALPVLKPENLGRPCLSVSTWSLEKKNLRNVLGKWLHILQVLQDSKIENYLDPWEHLAKTTLPVLKRKCEIKQPSQLQVNESILLRFNIDDRGPSGHNIRK